MRHRSSLPLRNTSAEEFIVVARAAPGSFANVTHFANLDGRCHEIDCAEIGPHLAAPVELVDNLVLEGVLALADDGR